MNEINVGISLRKPAESSYGFYKRFLIANQHFKEREIKSALEKLKIPSDIKWRRGNRVALAIRNEERYCKNNNIKFIMPIDIQRKEAVRNCWKCAASGYHSNAHQYLWLNNCPIHGDTEITEICPECQHYWPEIEALRSATCHTCGYKISIETLHALRAFEITDKHRELEFLINNFNRFYSLNRLIAYTSKQRINTITLRDPPEILDKDFPCIFSTFFPESRKNFLALGVKQKKPISFTFNLNKDLGALTNFGEEGLSDIRQKVDQRIRKYFKFNIDIENFSHLALVDQYKISVFEDVDIVGYSYILWKEIISEVPEYRRGYTCEAYNSCISKSLPLVPVLTDCFSEISDFDNLDLTRENEIHRQLPIGAQLLLYEIDLWCCFKSILKYMDTLKSTRKNQFWEHFYNNLPSWSHPISNYNPSTSVLLKNKNEIIITFPQFVIGNDLRHLYLKTLKID